MTQRPLHSFSAGAIPSFSPVSKKYTGLSSYAVRVIGRNTSAFDGVMLISKCVKQNKVQNSESQINFSIIDKD